MLNRRRRRILLVEHDPLMAKIVARELERHHRVFVVSSISAALRKLTIAGAPVFDVVLSAYRLRGETGLKLHEIVARRWPYLRRLLYADTELIPDKATRHTHTIIQLPGTFDDSLRAVDE